MKVTSPVHRGSRPAADFLKDLITSDGLPGQRFERSKRRRVRRQQRVYLCTAGRILAARLVQVCFPFIESREGSRPKIDFFDSQPVTRVHTSAPEMAAPNQARAASHS